MNRDVVVIGGGVIGCSIALRLAQAGASVTVIERGAVGCEASRAAAGMLSPQAESEKPDAFFRLALKSRAMYREFVEELSALSGINAQYRDEGTLVVSVAGTTDNFDRWVTWQLETGLRLERLTKEALREVEPAVTESATGAIFLPDDHQVDNRLLMDALAVAIRRTGVRIIENTEVAGFLIESGRAVGVAISDEKVYAGAVVVAAGSWSGKLFEQLRAALPTIPVRGQMLALRSSALRHVLHSSHVYLVPRLDGRLLVGATVEYAGFQKAVTAAAVHTLLDAAMELVPALACAEVLETWSGLRPGTPDHLPILGRCEVDNLWLATGHFRNGILLAPATAELLCQSILSGREAAELKDFNLGRFAAPNSPRNAERLEATF